MTTIIDTDALLGCIEQNDLLHQRATQIAHLLAQHHATVFLLPTTISEFAILATIKIGFEQSKRMVDFILQQGYSLLDITNSMVYDANILYRQQTSKENSLFDCFTMVAAKRNSVDCIFSFDRGYTQNGFILAEQFLRNS